MTDWHTHVFTSTYTSDVSGACSVMYELGGLSVLHDPSGCNSTYTTHDEPRWYDSKSLMFVSGLDEMEAVFGDDEKLIKDVKQACERFHPRFVMLCGASIPHIIGFDYRGVARLIEKQVGIPVLAVETNGLYSYVYGVSLASKEWIKRFVKQKDTKQNCINLLGVTPIDFANSMIVEGMKKSMISLGYDVNCTFAMGETFSSLLNLAQASCNLVVSSCGLLPAKYMQQKFQIPYVEGLPVGKHMRNRIAECMKKAQITCSSCKAYEENNGGNIVVIGEEIYAKSLATEINDIYDTQCAFALYPDLKEGLDEDMLIQTLQQVDIVVCDPLFQNVIPKTTKCIQIPHVGYSGRIFRNNIPVFTSLDFDIKKLIEGEKK